MRTEGVPADWPEEWLDAKSKRPSGRYMFDIDEGHAQEVYCLGIIIYAPSFPCYHCKTLVEASLHQSHCDKCNSILDTGQSPKPRRGWVLCVMLAPIHRGDGEFERVGCAIWEEEDWNKLKGTCDIQGVSSQEISELDTNLGSDEVIIRLV
ncbi:uncharacterized protein BDZ99DRAFT_474255 [Mytilinidion resinicola]|uniref:Uncharacterized protein n=1 Tax=Mytilinidion resinicola TaxID=574789 RepID=A0A6A6YXE7_9PEZI|nr:uncharacterized protein BDZ99DRAFT_474255 [Mytilinidion resinicola]KAF2813626.1 hypothetical protein BDZ99DRAFT_474255 [Mytilinidion resinicola]